MVRFICIHHAERPLRFPKNIIQRIADRFISAYFFASNELAQPWIDRKQIMLGSKVHEVMEVSSIFRSSKGTDEKLRQKNYLWVGRFDKNKDPLTLVRAFKKFLKNFPGATLQIIYRGGTLRKEVEDIIPNEISQRSIILTEDVPHEELQKCYDNAGFIISTSHYEGSGTAVCEGMSCGCIPILTSIPSFKVMTAHGKTGLLFTPGDEHSLAQALEKSAMFDMAEEREKVFRQYRDHLSPEAIAEKSINIVQKL